MMRVRRTVMTGPDPLDAPVRGTERREVAGVVMDVARAGDGRVKRVVYRPGFRWSTHMKPIVGTDQCMHAHVGFLVSGRIEIRFPDGCTRQYAAPEPVVIEAGHDGAVVGDEPAVLIEFDFEGDTASRFGLPERHQHTA
jgi:hypothetical protein